MSSGRPPEEWDPKLQMQRAWAERLERGWAELEDAPDLYLSDRDGDEWLPDWATKHRLLHGVLWWVSTGVIGVWFGPVIAVGWSLGWPLAVFGVAAAHGGITLRGRNAIDPMRHESEPPVGCPPSEVRQVGRAVRAAEQSLMEIAPKIQATSEVARYVQEHGGRLYVWVDTAGLGHFKTTPPRHAYELIEIAADGFSFYQDRSTEPPRFWKLNLRRFPRRLEVLWNGVRPSSGQ